MRLWLRDPFVHCLLGGALLFAAHAWLAPDDDARIEVSGADVRRLIDQWTVQRGRPPSAAEMDALIDDHVREEVWVREAQRLGLGEGDVIIRRRLAQKLRFVTEDVGTLEPASEDALRDYYDQQAQRYSEPVRVSFAHVFLSERVHADPALAAARLLARPDLAETWRSRGEPFMLRRAYLETPLAEIERDFGPDFARALEARDEPAPEWIGPVSSLFGTHLVRVDGVRAAARLPFEAVEGRVRRDFDAARRQAANDARLDALRARYEVVVSREAAP